MNEKRLIAIIIISLILTACSNDDNDKNKNEAQENLRNSAYDLGTLPDIVADIEWPLKPEITKQIEVTNNTEFQNAASINGISAKVLAGTYNDINITCNDCEFILEDAAEIKGRLSFTGTRIHWVGGLVTTGPIVMDSEHGDILIDNLHAITNGGKLNNFSGAATEWNRVALINSTLEVQNGNNDGDWALFVQGKNGTDFRGKNFILANVRLESDAQNNRFQSIKNLVIVDSYFNSNNTSKNGLRMHRGCEDVYMRDVIIVGANTNSGEETQVINGVFERITRYNDVNNHFSIGIGFNTVNVTINDSQCYTSASNSNAIGKPPVLGVATGVNPGLKTWDGIVVPNSSNVGADH
ncbi:hypothetical protein [Flavivirga eckloniae]|uniref:Right handed beta helix domain-containing protein n=1 Tax=Flavivirga eckloniae TaxID=1803846 RepID=A0A2K9PSY7_9FLAO|nr:hypothetical protein [Flavivirga eckloniae]AUP80180.1 hypothetical protein C1H87_16275 [Flavivirga eckloniae]